MEVQPSTGIERHYSVRSVAEIFDRSDDWVLDRIKAGEFPRLLDLGASRAAYRIPESVLKEYIKTRTVEIEVPGAGTPGER
ncbi:hypothetical protein G7068_11835 [Leucobacter viscericola]|uniref:Helix-turn-helix domain-containing protein n=1 Tax=Leucobacter viscericola TaxID=2714935 RepID=A0A6G7XH73_9MICO|nr:hypothetical protein [Leucobacter viscericola]QIK63799.1 hypothetical protein G7068_11835 [Leucobacter viscericola]